MTDKTTYNENIKMLKKISSDDANNLLSTEDLVIIYIGRETCPYCRKFAITLNKLASKINNTIYYIDSSNPSDDAIHSFREKYNILTVPGFIVGKSGSIDVRCDSSTSEEELLNMIK